MYFAEDFIEKVRTQSDIISIISEYTNLVQKGRSYIGRCPFHNEKTPSFSVSEEQQMYHCFGCGVGGNVITFMMEKENLSFMETIEELATKANIPLEYDNNKKYNNREVLLKKDIIFELYKKAARFYYYNLTRNAPDYVKEYLKNRELTEQTIRLFGLGFSPNSYTALYKYLSKEDVTDEILIESGLCIRALNGKIYDRFINRLMFPIISPTKKVVAFGGRVFGDEKPKYLNSAENPIFHKSNTLYGLNLAKNANHDYYILVEGYMDVVAMHINGFTNTVASLGTAFTDGQAKLLKRYTKDIVILYDNDNAGQKATLKAIKILKDNDFSVKVLELKNAKDPDEFLTNFGSHKLKNMLLNAKSDVWYQISKIQNLYNLNNLPEKVKFLEQTAEIIANLSSSIEQQLYIDEISLRFTIDKKAIESEIKKKIINTKDNKIVYENHSKKVDLEVNLLSVLYHNPNLYNEISQYLFPELFTKGIKQNIAINLFNKESIDTKNYYSIEEQKIISSIIINENMQNIEFPVVYKMIKQFTKGLNLSYYKKLIYSDINPEKFNNLIKRKFETQKLNIIPKNG
ncbi:DNA primase [Candidatus Epulonipiscioides gigas]|nr:DNA primase [Epulopiscium sp. SCG-C07WGA-EpuloA2]